MTAVRLDKVKRPGGVYSFDLRDLARDGAGLWLFGAAGSAWRAPGDRGTLPMNILVLLSEDRPFVAWWVDDPAGRRLEVDVCIPPSATPDGWSLVDLELDPIRHESTGVVEVEDHDEFEAACKQQWISEEDARLALATSVNMAAALRTRTEPWGDEGWVRLDVAARQDSSAVARKPST